MICKDLHIIGLMEGVRKVEGKMPARNKIFSSYCKQVNQQTDET